MTKHKERIFSDSDCLSLDAILRYLHDQSSLQERHKVEKHMLECELCKEAVEGYSLMEEKSKAAGIMADLNKGITENPDSIFNVRRLAAGVAAVLVLGGGLFYLNNNLEPVNDSVAIQKHKSNTDSLKPEKLTEEGANEHEPIVYENAKPKVPESEKNIAYKFNKSNSNEEVLKEEDISDAYPLEMGNEIPHNAAVPKEEEKKAQAAMAADTAVSMKDQIAYDYTMPAAGASESDKMLLKEEVIMESRKKDERIKSKSRSDNRAPSAEKMRDVKSEVKPDDLEIGIQRYQEKKFTEASVVFEKIIKSDSSNFKALYYNGLSYFESEKWDKAIENFNCLKNGNEFYEDGLWKKAMALSNKGNKAGAMEIFEEMAGREGSYKEKAMEELKKLEK